MGNNTSKYFITYGNQKYNIQRKRLAHQARKLGCFDEVISYSKNNLSFEFKKKYEKILKNDQGGGFWIWKPFILLKLLEETKENDLILYLDAGSTLNPRGRERMNEYFQMLEESNKSFLRFDIGLKEKYWTSKEVFFALNKDVESVYGNSNQLAGGVIFIKNTKHSKEYFRHFFKIIDSDLNLITNYYKDNQIAKFKTSRHDQSLLSLMGKVYDSLILPDETYFFENPDNQYEFPILTVRDGNYSLWQKIKYYSLYFLNINKIIYFGHKQFYFKKNSILWKVKNKLNSKFITS